MKKGICFKRTGFSGYFRCRARYKFGEDKLDIKSWEKAAPGGSPSGFAKCPEGGGVVGSELVGGTAKGNNEGNLLKFARYDFAKSWAPSGFGTGVPGKLEGSNEGLLPLLVVLLLLFPLMRGIACSPLSEVQDNLGVLVADLRPPLFEVVLIVLEGASLAMDG